MPPTATSSEARLRRNTPWTPSSPRSPDSTKTGVWLGTRLQSFNLWPDHPNHIEPGKRPRITLTPTLVLKEGKPALAVSVAGGDNQDQITLQLVLNHIDFGLAPAESVTAPRFLTGHFLGSFRQAPPKLGHLQINAEVGPDVLADLASRGHKVVVGKPPLGANPTALSLDPESGRLEAAGDPRAGRHASAY